LSDAVKLYLAGHRKRDNEDFTGDVGRNWKCLIDIVGDKPFVGLSRADARTFIDKRCADGLKTGSVRRQLKSIAAVVSMVLREREMEKVSPFIRLDIPNEHLDVVQRDILSPDQLRTLADACKAKDDDMRWAIALQMDLGSRTAEVVGLALADLHVDAEIPYVDIKPHPWRILKNKGAARPVALVGLALWAARRIKATAMPQQVYAFPRYIDDTGTRAKCKAVGASSTFNKWMRGMGIDRTTHCFRHTMRDRLREVEAPHDIQHAIGGWGKQDQGDKYGRGYKLDVLLPWLNKVVVV